MICCIKTINELTRNSAPSKRGEYLTSHRDKNRIDLYESVRINKTFNLIHTVYLYQNLTGKLLYSRPKKRLFDSLTD